MDDSTAYYESHALLDSTAHISGDSVEVSDCARGVPERVIKSTIEPQPVFELNATKDVGTESVVLRNGERLIVKNHGCEYYVLTFRFETSRFEADTTDTRYWLEKAAILAGEIMEVVDAPLDLNDGVVAINKFCNTGAQYVMGEEIVYKQGDIRQFVSLDRVQRIARSRYGVEVSFVIGPL